MLAAGFAAHRGYLSLPWVMTVALAGGMAGDQICFLIGRLRGRGVLDKRPWLASRAGRVDSLLLRYGTPVMLGFRFVYGMRTVTPLLVGISSIPAWRFALLNALGALIWSSAVSTGGYLFGSAIEGLLGNVKRIEAGVIAIILATGAALWGLHLLRKRRMVRKSDYRPPDDEADPRAPR